ncbi:MAG: LegC family aminotransferase [Candidatus Margulisiibacteriota bacterium]
MSNFSDQCKVVIDFIKEQFPNKDFIPLHEPSFSGNEKKYVLDCIDSTFVSSVGKYVDQFEDMVAHYTGAKHAIATVNGTAALHIALLLAGVKENSEVITQPLTFVATCNAIQYCGAKPVFVDVSKRTLGLCPEQLLEFLKNKTRQSANGLINTKSGRVISACVPMHTFGHPAQIDEIVSICSQFNLPIVEDAAESLGSLYKGQHTGTFGLLGTLSFNGNKTITTGGGGMILTNNDELAKQAKHITTTAKVPHKWAYIHDELGYNYRLPNINAALGCAQMEQLNQIIDAKRQLAEKYKLFFKNMGISFIEQPEGAISNYWLNTIQFKNKEERDTFLTMSNDQNVMTRPCWELMNHLEYLKPESISHLENAELFSNTLVNIASSVR